MYHEIITGVDKPQISQIADIIPTEGGFRLKWTDGPFSGKTLSVTDWHYITLTRLPPRSYDDGTSLVFADKAAAEWAATEIIIRCKIGDVPQEMLLKTVKTYYHATEREHASDIMQHGFIGGWGDVGFGVYFYGTIYQTRDYAAEGGWDGKLEDPVILAVTDSEIDHVTDLDPSWDATRYTDMHWHPMDDHAEDGRWKPAKIEVVG